MKVDELSPTPEQRVSFKLSSYKSVPQKAGCYVLSSFEDDILYVGLSKNLFARFQQHLSNPEKTNPTECGKAIWFYFLLYDENNLQKLERTWLNSFISIHGVRPILNKIDSAMS